MQTQLARSAKYIFPALFSSLKIIPPKRNSSLLLFFPFFLVLPPFHRAVPTAVGSAQPAALTRLLLIHPGKLKPGHQFWELTYGQMRKGWFKSLSTRNRCGLTVSLAGEQNLASANELTREGENYFYRKSKRLLFHQHLVGPGKSQLR